MLALACGEDGRLGCVVLESAEGDAFSETITVEDAGRLLSRFLRADLLRRY